MLATDLLLLALDDESGRVLPPAAIGLDYGLAGALLLDLALHGDLHVDGDRVTANGTSAEDPMLEEARRLIAATPRQDLSHWVRHLPQAMDALRQRLLDRLVAQGTLEKREQRVLLLFHRNVYPERNGRVEHDIRARMDGVLLRRESPDPHTACLIQLAAACRVLEAIYPKSQHKAIRARIAALGDAGSAGAKVVAGMVTQAETAAVSAAMMAAVMASTIAATSAATTAACSASSVACR